ncbi:hypothetical protein SLEP1_g39371 [Rubroshorea leprosula]|uniref:Uncharacterized protein n=1 Tax=Rubroshorea leprosula TaxID=152421 RepID=A0AAV5L0L9_9ROSI|nr:hypothetical protein SLEP1_g39371 [Rubroshorea leprosula]
MMNNIRVLFGFRITNVHLTSIVSLLNMIYTLVPARYQYIRKVLS